MSFVIKAAVLFPASTAIQACVFLSAGSNNFSWID